MIIRKFILSHELIRYLLVGITTIVINLIIYYIFIIIGLEYWIANAFAIVFSKLYAFTTNKLLVFRTKQKTVSGFLQEAKRFFLARSFTGLIDYFGLIVAVEFFGADKLISKYVLQVIVIVLNYIMGKHLVFKK